MKANEKSRIDGLAKKAFESIVDEVPEEGPTSECAYRMNPKPIKARQVRRPIELFPLVACAMALIMVIPPAIGKTRTTLADVATAACESGRFDGSAEFMTMVFARAGERIRQSREMEK